MNSFRKSVLSMCCATLLTSISVTASAAEVLKAADVHPEGYPTVAAMQNLGKKLEKRPCDVSNFDLLLSTRGGTCDMLRPFEGNLYKIK